MPLSPLAKTVEDLDRLAKSPTISRDQFVAAMKRAASVYPGDLRNLIQHLVSHLGLDLSDAADYLRGNDYPMAVEERKNIVKAVSDELYRKSSRV